MFNTGHLISSFALCRRPRPGKRPMALSPFLAICGFLILSWVLAGPAPADENVEEKDGSTTTIIMDEKPEKPAYDPYQRFDGDSAKDPRERAKEVKEMFPEEVQKEKERKAARAARSREEKDREKRLLDKEPPLLKKINPTLKHRDSIPKRF